MAAYWKGIGNRQQTINYMITICESASMKLKMRARMENHEVEGIRTPEPQRSRGTSHAQK